MSTTEERNTAAMKQTLTDVNERSFAQKILIDGLSAAVGTLTERIANLEGIILAMRVKAAGSGPSVR